MRTITHNYSSIKALLRGWVRLLTRQDVYTALIVILVGLSSFSLGRLSAQEAHRPPVRIIGPENQTLNTTNTTAAATALSTVDGEVVGSKNGSKYHFPWCSGAQRIKEENKVWFATIADAEAAGYTPAANCKGL